ncbi:MAG: SusD/RagB family nutrient-binding outer membrane lipoprotein [Lewinella sp.]|nr:SusD/RagB family nutrient-binding outer membrane lipoprotein [Lewinella sp.]
MLLKSRYILLLALAFTLGACSDYLDINIDPNAPENPGDLDLLLADVTATTSYNLVGGGNWTRFGAQWMQQVADNSTPPNDDTYRINTSDCNNEWAFYSYAGVLINCKRIIELGEEAGQVHHVGIAKIMMAHNYALLTDFWGKIPFSEALQRESNGKPAYDDQEAVYLGIQQLLDEGIANLEKDSPVTAGGGDLYYGGDAQAWIRLAYALKARYYLRLTNAPGYDPQQQATLALDALDKAMTSTADEARFTYGNDPGSEAPWNQWVNKFASTIQISDYFVSKLQALNDPRLPIMADQNQDGVYLGHPNGGNPTNTLAEISNIGTYYLAADFAVPLMTYVEQLFLQAEAHWRLNETVEAEAAYEEAIRLHMSELSGEGEFGTVIDAGAMDTYLAAHPLTSLEDLIEQKYIASFIESPFEAYNDYRRTGFPADLQAPAVADYDQIPTRMIYTDTEVNNNVENVPTGVTLTSKVWWDGD